MAIDERLQKVILEIRKIEKVYDTKIGKIERDLKLTEEDVSTKTKEMNAY